VFPVHKRRKWQRAGTSFRSLAEPDSPRESDWSTLNGRQRQSSQAGGDVLCRKRPHFHRAGLDFYNEAVSGEQSAGDLEFRQGRRRVLAVFRDDCQRGLDELNELLALEPFLNVIVWGKQEHKIGGDLHLVPASIIALLGR
jgi:hypothetical protein